jgi:hypothetical protein
MNETALFVKGHNTFGVDNYRAIEDFLHARDISVTYIDYELTEDISSVYKRMCKTIRKGKFTYLIGHSMGGFLLYKYIALHPKQTTKCILLMPLVHKDIAINLVTKIPYIENISLPKLLIYPKNNLYNGGNIWNDMQLTKIIPIKQICQCYDRLPSDDMLVQTLNSRPNCILFHASEDKFTKIPENILYQLKNLQIVEGKHELYKDPETAPAFFKALRKCLLPRE